MYLVGRLNLPIKNNYSSFLLFPFSVHGGRSRFHLIDLSGCSRKKRSRDSGQGAWLPLSALGNVLVSVANGTKHIPHRDSKLTTLLREAMGSLSARVTMIANVSQEPRHCFETLATFQVTSRIHRSRKRKSRVNDTSLNSVFYIEVFSLNYLKRVKHGKIVNQILG